MKAQRPLLGVKNGGGGGGKIFSSGNLMSCPELYSQVKSDNNFFCLAGILGARSQLCKGLFSDFFYLRREISIAVQNCIQK